MLRHPEAPCLYQRGRDLPPHRHIARALEKSKSAWQILPQEPRARAHQRGIEERSRIESSKSIRCTPPTRPWELPELPYSFTFLNRSALLITDTELKLMAAAAKIGLRRIPKNGYSTPAATGTPIAL